MPLSAQDYLLKIIDTPGLLQPEQVSALFGNIESIYALNRYEWVQRTPGSACEAHLGASRGILDVLGVMGSGVWAQGLISRMREDGPSLYRRIVSSLQERGPVGPRGLGLCAFLGSAWVPPPQGTARLLP